MFRCIRQYSLTIQSGGNTAESCPDVHDALLMSMEKASCITLFTSTDKHIPKLAEKMAYKTK